MLKSILHPTDFSLASDYALAHALRLAVANKARLTILLVHQGSSSKEWTQFAGVRTLLARWGMLPEGFFFWPTAGSFFFCLFFFLSFLSIFFVYLFFFFLPPKAAKNFCPFFSH